MPNRKLAPAIAAGLLLMICLAFSSINAQETQNGMETRTPRKMSDRTVGASLMGPVPTNGPWVEFAFFGKGIAATGCSPADPSGPGCAPSSAGNSVFGSAPPWTFTAPAGGANLTVTDAFLRGDQFEISDFGTPIGSTSIPATTGACGDDPVPCLADSGVSHGVFPMAAGAHSITIKAKASPFGGGAAYFRIDAAPASLDHWLCYDVKPRGKFRQRLVAISNQFEKMEYIVIAPRLLCVPSTKKLLK
ncbi:MAG: hypothetical protein ABI698_07690 [bacterium]